MELPEHLPLADLKKAIKQFKTEQTPKLSSKKSVLMEYATRVGLVRGKAPSISSSASVEEVEEPRKRVPVEAQVAPIQPRPAQKKALPEALKKLVEKPIEKPIQKKGLKTPEPEKPRGSPFASFMADNKGKGLSMSQLAELYRRQK